MAGLDVTPKAIFISTFCTAPLAADMDYVLAESLSDFQAGVNALAKVAPVHVSIHKGESAFAKVKDCQIHVVSGPHPAGNVGVQISHIAPIMKGETVWTVNPLHVAAIGHVVNTGKLELTRKVAVTGPAAQKLGYVVAMPGMPVKEIADIAGDVRVVGGDVLCGETWAPTATWASSRTRSPSCGKAMTANGSAGPSPSVPRYTALPGAISPGLPPNRSTTWTPTCTAVHAPS